MWEIDNVWDSFEGRRSNSRYNCLLDGSLCAFRGDVRRLGFQQFVVCLASDNAAHRTNDSEALEQGLVLEHKLDAIIIASNIYASKLYGYRCFAAVNQPFRDTVKCNRETA